MARAARRSLFAASIAFGLGGATLVADRAAAAERCRLGGDAKLDVAERVTPGGTSTSVVVRAGAAAPLAEGDVIRQANGTRVARCADLERASADARRAGLVLLLAVERNGRVLVAALPSPDGALALPALAAVSSAPDAALPPTGQAQGLGAIAARPAGGAPLAGLAAEGALPAPRPTITPRPAALAALPVAAQAPPAVRSAARDAADVLSELERSARPSVSLPAYDARLRQTEERIAQLDGSLAGPSSASSAVRGALDGILAYYRAASDIRRYQQDYVRNRATERPGRSPVLPYVSTSPVPRWVAEYPFLDAAIVSQPRADGLFGAEQAGAWDPDRAVELLWSHASTATERLGAWATAGG